MVFFKDVFATLLKSLVTLLWMLKKRLKNAKNMPLKILVTFLINFKLTNCVKNRQT